MLYLKHLSTGLSIVVSKNDVRLVGPKSLGPVQEFVPGLGNNAIVTWHCMTGM